LFEAIPLGPERPSFLAHSAVNPAYTSRTCSGCQAIKESLGRSERVYTCQHCGLVADRDSNAAINILRAGNALRQTAQAA